MNEDEYTIQELSKTFARHAEFARKEWDELEPTQKKQIEENPRFEGYFNISSALMTICKEIEKLKKES